MPKPLERTESTGSDWRKWTESTGLRISEFAWRICSALIPGTFLLWTRLWDWYEVNPHHKFKTWDILILKWNAIGYWVRPVAVVNWYAAKDWAWKYNVTMHGDLNWDITKKTIPEWAIRESRPWEIHFKWNIENQFRKVEADSPEEALLLYKSVRPFVPNY